MAQTRAPITADLLRTPTRAAAVVSDSQQDAYRTVMAAYAREEVAHPDDAALVMAQCRFIEGFADGDDEELSWGEAAQADGQACQKDLETRFHGDPEPSLYLAEHRYGKNAISYAHPLLPASNRWSPSQRSRLHAALARGYVATKQPKLAGQEALASVQLDPGSNQLVPALDYLCDEGRRSEAESLLSRAPAPSQGWAESQRVRFALDNLSAADALAELQRAEATKTPIDPWLSARVYQRAEMNGKAADLLTKVNAKPEYQSVEQFQLRVNVSAGHGDGNAASVALHDWFGKTGTTVPLLLAYGTTLAHAPGELFSSSLAPLALTLLAVLAALACLPGLIAFPAHYRGSFRTGLQKQSQPLFAPIGLRHMWLALGAFLVISTLVPLLGTANALQALTSQRPMSAKEETTAVMAELAMLVMGTLCLLPVICRLSWREWLGDRGIKISLITVLSWTLVKALFLWVASHAPHSAGLLHSTPHDRSVAALAVAATHIGGAGLAMLIVAVLVPIYEELVFRGFVLGGLARHISFGWANFWQALLFSLLHFDFPHFVFYFLLGLMAGWLARRTRGLAAPMLLHAANNAVACIALLVTT
jgi:membrane protease YdiL (CAAX protease family)